MVFDNKEPDAAAVQSCTGKIEYSQSVLLKPFVTWIPGLVRDRRFPSTNWYLWKGIKTAHVSKKIGRVLEHIPKHLVCRRSGWTI